MVERQLIPLSSQLQLIDRLQHLIYLSSSFIFLSGEQGSGKSTLIEQLSNRIPGNIQQVFIALNDHSSDSQIRQKILTQLYKQPLFDAQDSLLSSMEQLQEKQGRDIPRLIILDHAEHLSATLLIELLQIIIYKKLFGESEINILLLASEHDNKRMLSFVNQASLKQESQCACLEFKLEPLTSDEANSLLNHIFKQTQYQPKIQHQDALQQKVAACAGVPQKIISMAEQISAAEFQNKELSWLKIRFPPILLMFFLLITVAALANYLYPKFFKPLKPIAEVEAIIEDKAVLLTEINDTHLIISEAPSQEESPELVEKLAGSWSNKATAEIKDNQLAVGISDEGVQRVVISDPEILNLADLPQGRAVGIEGGQELSAVTEPKDLQREEKFAVIEGALEDIEPVTEQGEGIGEVNILEIQDGAESKPQTASTLSDKTEAKVVVTVRNKSEVIAKAQSSIFTKNAQLLAIASTHFTLQLSAMESKKTLQEFVSTHKLPQPSVYVYQTVRNNKPWYVIIFGDYKSRLLAQKASKTLSGSFAKMEPWIKKYQLVHQDLRLNNE